MIQRLTACLPVVLLMCAAVVLLAPAAGAQQRYELEGETWQAIQPPDPGSPEGQIQTIRKLLAEGKGKRAWKAANKWIKTHGEAEHPLTVEAYLLRGDAWVARNNPYKALFDYEYLIRRYPASEQFHTALDREFEIARMYVNGRKRPFLGLTIFPADGDGAEVLIRIQERAPGSEIGERAHLLLADYYFNDGQMANSAEVYDLFLDNYPQSDKREFATLRAIQANLARYKGPNYDQRGLIEARQRLSLYRDEFPAAAEQIGADALIVRIRESLARRDLLNADWYAKRDDNVSAGELYRRIITDYPDTAAAQDAVVRLQEIGQPVVLAKPDDLTREPARGVAPNREVN